MNRAEAIEFLELVKVCYIDDNTSLYHDEIHEALDMAIDLLSNEDEEKEEELRERVSELEELLQDPSRISSRSYYTLGRL